MEKLSFTEDELQDIISRAMICALKDDWIPPAEFTKKIVNEYYEKVHKELNELLNGNQ